MDSLAAGPASPRLREDLVRLAALADGGSLPVSAVLAASPDRGYAMAVFLLALPFVLPFPTLGMALPIGSLLAVAGLALALGRPALPSFLARRRIASPALVVLARATGRPLRLMERFVRPRLGLLLTGPLRVALGLSMAVAAVVLALPIPLPLSNFFPAVPILLLAVGLLERDGLLVLAGHLATLGVCAGLYLASGLAWAGVLRGVAWLRWL